MARELGFALTNLCLNDVFRKAKAQVERAKQAVAPTRNVYNSATGATITEVPKDGRKRKQIPTHSSM